MARYKSWEALPPHKYYRENKRDHYVVPYKRDGKWLDAYFDNYVEAIDFAKSSGTDHYYSVWTDEFGYVHTTFKRVG